MGAAGSAGGYALAIIKKKGRSFTIGSVELTSHFQAGLGQPQEVVPVMSTPLPFLREIDSAITRSTGRRRAEMVRQLTDLYLVNADQYSDDEIALIDEVFVRLVATIEESARALLAIRLGPYAKAPPKILGILACEDAIDIASPVLIQGERLDEATLIMRQDERVRSISWRSRAERR